MARRQVQVVGLGIIDLKDLGLRCLCSLAGCLCHRLQQSIQSSQRGRCCQPLVLVKGAQALQPSIKGLVQLRPQCRRLVEELAGPIPHRGGLTREGALSGEEFVEDDPSREDV
ncbi:hypothetical protein SDC9_78524 [bioreactor metagenome]|uniref:Uncharacterized protein n=1 Tax=bioreactor metagenome TaxID=1076179 RepID=A0A644YUH7_9ZZZZ